MISPTRFLADIKPPGIGLGAFLALTLAGTGCSHLRPFHEHDLTHPEFGTESSAVKPLDPTDNPAPDPYLEGLRQSRADHENDLRDLDLQAAKSRGPQLDARTDPAIEARRDTPPVIPNTLEEPRIRLQEPEAPSRRPLDTGLARANTPAISTPKAPAEATLAGLIAQSRRRVESLSTYQVPMRYQEQVAGTLQPLDSAVLSIRRQPKRVRIEWREGPNKGREVLYAADLHDGLMHVRMGGVMKALPRFSMKPESPLASRSSRHPITEAGFETIVTRMEEGLEEAAAGSVGGTRLRYLGLEQPDGLTHSCHKIERVTPSGETWLVYLHPETSLPTIVQANAPNGQLLELYVFGEPVLDHAELAENSAFDPDARWGPAGGGFLQKLAKANRDKPETSPKP